MMSEPMTRVGLQFSTFSFPGVPDERLFAQIATIAQAAERSGFDSLWVMDHLHQIATVGDREDPILEAYTTLAGLAALTRTARLGVLVSACGFRNPALLAKMVTTIDLISQGRAILGIGAGWFEDEYVSYGYEFPGAGDRLRMLAECIQICRAMFTEHAPSFHGRHHRIAQPLNIPPPVAPAGPPIMVGGGGERTLIPLIARYGDGSNFFGGTETVRHKIGVLERACEAVGRDPATITKTWLGTALIADSERELQAGLERVAELMSVSPVAVRAFMLCGSADQISEQAARYRASGIDGVIVNMDNAADLQSLERVGKALHEAMR